MTHTYENKKYNYKSIMCDRPFYTDVKRGQ